jgi:hypothetical protein
MFASLTELTTTTIVTVPARALILIKPIVLWGSVLAL